MVSGNEPGGGMMEPMDGISPEEVALGTRSIVGLTPEAAKALLDFVAKSGGRPTYGFPITEVSSAVGLKGHALAAALSVATVMVIAAVRGGKDPKQTLRMLAAGLGGDESAAEQLRPTLQSAFERRRQYRRAIASRHLANAILPTVEEFVATVDLRLQFRGEKLDVAIPVAIALLTTDIDDQFLRFQLTREQAEKLSQDLSEVATQLERAERLMRGAADADNP